ncbi:hypothetical protein CONPUDRAFT_168949 [Coniophora puteana RWD-64-598 SS2]|uniref:Nucleoporin NUP188 n=1 Tax=Coniophora puteana (strain RWD-64-598) TaxID=741705 RepID=A0A5M3MAU6_CONPW|nr:uncharacterized protein CONPUDRAFT_168949 [Coniophora puteana RWD-64-598 SS2]EIW76402.1 hypothetical protein CONPUDRAFT_168949 [Coniophora puteana RWD-64-598 SS2]
MSISTHAESSKRSNLVDVTYQQLHSILSGHIEGTSPDQVRDLLAPRVDTLRDVAWPFGRPSDASRKAVESGKVELPDGVVLTPDSVDKECVRALSERFDIDEIHALVLLRSFLYNEGLPSVAGVVKDGLGEKDDGKDKENETERQQDSKGNEKEKEHDKDIIIAELLSAIGPFYYAERLAALRTLIPLFRAHENPADPAHPPAASALARILAPDGPAFVEALVSAYTAKTHAAVPAAFASDPRAAARWARQNVREQLGLLEVLFWALWASVPCTGALVVRVFETAYASALGARQRNATLLLDPEGAQLQRDAAALWVLVTVEVLELERVAGREDVDVAETPRDERIYTSDPGALERVHELVTDPANGDAQFACTYLAWAFVLSRLGAMAEEAKSVPSAYRAFFEKVMPHQHHHQGGRAKEREPLHVLMARTVVQADAGLFQLLLTLLTASPLFVTTVAWKTGSTVTDPNAVAYRSVLKGLIIALVELVPVEQIPDFDALVEVWIALFGRSEPHAVSGICRQFWVADWRQSAARRAIFDVARARFPVHFRPLVRLLRALSAAGFLDTDPLAASADSHSSRSLRAIAGDAGGQEGSAEAQAEEERAVCARHVFYYFDRLPTFSLVIPLASTAGPNAVYERVAHGASPYTGPGLSYTNLRPIVLPGGGVLPARSVGRLLSGDGGEHVAVCWAHEHSGWRVLVEVLVDYVGRRRMASAGQGQRMPGELYQDVSYGRAGKTSQPLRLKLEDVGMEVDVQADGQRAGDEAIATDALDLIRSIIQDDGPVAEELLEALEKGDATASPTNGAPPGDQQSQGQGKGNAPDLVQLTTTILEEALSRPRPRGGGPFAQTQLVTSAMSVLAALLALPKHATRVWLYLRSTAALFCPSGGHDSKTGFAAVALPAERAAGTYTMTRALLHLAQALLSEACASALAVLPGNRRLQQVKEEVLLRAAGFVHGEVWVEHLGWRYAQIGERFELGRRAAAFFADVLALAPPALGEGESRLFPALSRAVADVLLYRATTSSVGPLVSAIAAGPAALHSLYASRRYGDARRLVFLLEADLRLVRLVLNIKQQASAADDASENGNKPCLLEQALCSRVAGGAGLGDSLRARVDPVDVLATYVKERALGATVPLEAMRVLSALCASLAGAHTLVGHLANPEATVAALVRIVQHPYEELNLRNAVWGFISLAVDKEPALANLFVTGRFRVPSKGKAKEKEEKEGADGKEEGGSSPSAVDIASRTLVHWKELCDANPQLLASVLRFLDVVWKHGLEHKALIDATRKDTGFWKALAAITEEELGPDPDYATENFVTIDGARRSSLHEATSAQAYRYMVKSYAVHIIGQDMYLQPPPASPSDPLPKTISYDQLAPVFKSEDQLNELILEAQCTSFDPTLYDTLSQELPTSFPGLTLEQIRSQEPMTDREFGDDYQYLPSLLRSRLTHCATTDELLHAAEEVEKKVMSINLNLSLTQAQVALGKSWQFLLKQVMPFVRLEPNVRPILLTIAATVSADLAGEKRSGDMMARIHGTNLGLLLSLVEVAWFSTKDTDEEIKSFMKLVRNLHYIIQNEAQPPSLSFLGKVTTPFHRALLQIIYFTVRQCRNLSSRPKALNAERRLDIASMLNATLVLVIDALKLVFDTARTRLDLDVDRDMEFLVAIFEQCTRPDINVSSLHWLTRCAESDVIQASLELLVRADIAGLGDVALLRQRRQPLYAPHVLTFHMALASVPAGAERFASAGFVSAYSNNALSTVLSAAALEVVLPEFPGERSPAHCAYVGMVAVVASVVSTLGVEKGRQQYSHYFFDREACGFVQHYGRQLERALGWRVGEPITLPLLEEMEEAVHLFGAIARNAHAGPSTSSVKRGSKEGGGEAVEKVLRAFSTHALRLLQQINYALTHPHHLASLLEPVTAEERALFDREPRDGGSSTSSALTLATSLSASASALDMLDLQKHPLTARLVHRLFRLAGTLACALNDTSQAYDVLLGEQDEWPTHEALVVPHSKVVLSEATSLGTLLELSNVMLDALRALVSRPPGQALAPPTSVTGPTENPLDAAGGARLARTALEALLLYSITQLALWLAKPDFDPATSSPSGGGDMEMDELQPHADGGRELSLAPASSGSASGGRKSARGASTSLTLAERLRRGMTGEMASDLQSLLGKSKPVLAKSESVLGQGQVDLTDVLTRFLNERIIAA